MSTARTDGRCHAPTADGWGPVVASSVLAALPALFAAVRLVVTHPPVYYLGDQAVEDVLARDSVLGHNLLGVYSRYGWHHPGPMWLDLLGLFRLPSASSTIAVSLGGLVLQAAWCVVACVAASRLSRSLLWPTAAAVALVLWSLGYVRMVSLWNPWAVVVPTLALLLVAAGAIAAERPGPWLLVLAVTATFMVQTDISTVVVVVAVVLTAVVLSAWKALRRRPGARPHLGRWSLITAGAIVVLWAQPVWQQLTVAPGNARQLWRFELAKSREHTVHHAYLSARAVDTVLGLFAFRLDAFSNDALPSNLTNQSVLDRPFLYGYVLASVLLLAWAARRRDIVTFSLALISIVALLALFLSAQTSYGLLYPYILLWGLAIAALPWIAAVGLVVAGARWHRVPVVVAALAASALATGAAVPYAAATGVDEELGQFTWGVLAPEIMAPGVHTVAVRTTAPGAAPLVDAIEDAALDRGRQVDLTPADAARYDPERGRQRGPAQLSIVFCCGVAAGDEGPPPPGMRHLATIDVFQVYVSP